MSARERPESIPPTGKIKVHETEEGGYHDHVLFVSLPWHDDVTMHGSHNGNLTIERYGDGSFSVSTRRDVHAWGSSEEVRFTPEVWEIIKAFVDGGPGGRVSTPFVGVTPEQARMRNAP